MGFSKLNKELEKRKLKNMSTGEPKSFDDLLNKIDYSRNDLDIKLLLDKIQQLEKENLELKEVIKILNNILEI